MQAENSLLAHDLLTLWFGEPGDSDYGQFREIWFQQNDDLDALITARFTEPVTRAAAGALDSLADTAMGTLALVLLLDQVPRNIYRDSPNAFATDAKARATARAALDLGFDKDLLPVQRLFLYLPFMHSEELDDQDLSVSLCKGLGPVFSGTHSYAENHRDIIRRFGRFPHRNQVLGRISTTDEQAFLATEGRGF